MVVYLLEVALQFILIALLQLLLDKTQFLESFAGQGAEAVEDGVAAGGLDFKGDLAGQQFLQSDEVVILNA